MPDTPTPPQPPANPAPAGAAVPPNPLPQDHQYYEAYGQYLSEFYRRKNEPTKAPTATASGGATTITTPLTVGTPTAAAPASPAPAPGDRTKPAAIVGVEGGKKVGANVVELLGDTEFNLPLPLSPEDFIKQLEKKQAAPSTPAAPRGAAEIQTPAAPEVPLPESPAPLPAAPKAPSVQIPEKAVPEAPETTSPAASQAPEPAAAPPLPTSQEQPPAPAPATSPQPAPTTPAQPRPAGSPPPRHKEPERTPPRAPAPPGQPPTAARVPSGPGTPSTKKPTVKSPRPTTGKTPPTAPPEAGQDLNRAQAKARGASQGARGGSKTPAGALPAGAPVTPGGPGAPTPSVTPPEQSGGTGVGQRIASALQTRRTKLKRAQNQFQKELDKLEGKLPNLRTSPAMRVVKFFLPGVYAKVSGALHTGKNVTGQAKIAALQARTISLTAAKDSLQIGRGVGSIIDATKALIQFITATSGTIIIPVVAVLLSPLIVLIMTLIFAFLGGGTITKALDKLIEQINTQLKPLKQLLENEKRKVALRQKIGAIDEDLAGGQAAGPDVTRLPAQKKRPPASAGSAPPMAAAA